MERDWSSMNSTRTWVTPPREPVRPRTFVTFASLTLVLVEASCWWVRARDSQHGPFTEVLSGGELLIGGVTRVASWSSADAFARLTPRRPSARSCRSLGSPA